MSLEAAWAHILNPGQEKLNLEVSALGVMANGEVDEKIASRPYRFHYSVLCDPDWNLKQLTVERIGHPTTGITLFTDGRGRWYNAACEELKALEGCSDMELSASAFTNTIPIRRLDLSENERAELRVAFVDAYTLGVGVSQQRYTCLRRGESESAYFYEGLATGIRVEIKVDADGLVLDYPNVFRRNLERG
ncbi:MAG TPA: putative glycolipid-binding domain-containing protein [Conexivisphaerales archaeon]|nr:putative glycolipid-binding domain-containing protein [Conexivisphaerales archaeon]